MMPGTPAATTSFSAASSSVRAAPMVGVGSWVAALAGLALSVRLARTVMARASFAEFRDRWLGPPRRDGSLVGGGEITLGNGNTGFMRSCLLYTSPSPRDG